MAPLVMPKFRVRQMNSILSLIKRKICLQRIKLFRVDNKVNPFDRNDECRRSSGGFFFRHPTHGCLQNKVECVYMDVF